MQQIQTDLWQTKLERPSPGLTTHAYLLTREQGNVLFYNTSHGKEIAAMAGLGGVAWQCLSHRDELGASLRQIRDRYGNQLLGHRREQAEIEQVCPADDYFDQRQWWLNDVEVIPTPGHSPGSCCFRVRSVTGKEYLFTGDTLYRRGDGRWRAGFIPGVCSEEDRLLLADSLTLLATLSPDLVLSSAFAGGCGYAEMAPGEWPEQVAQARAGLLKGH